LAVAFAFTLVAFSVTLRITQLRCYIFLSYSCYTFYQQPFETYFHHHPASVDCSHPTVKTELFRRAYHRIRR